MFGSRRALGPPASLQSTEATGLRGRQYVSGLARKPKGKGGKRPHRGLIQTIFPQELHSWRRRPSCAHRACDGRGRGRWGIVRHHQLRLSSGSCRHGRGFFHPRCVAVDAHYLSRLSRIMQLSAERHTCCRLCPRLARPRGACCCGVWTHTHCRCQRGGRYRVGSPLR